MYAPTGVSPSFQASYSIFFFLIIVNKHLKCKVTHLSPLLRWHLMDVDLDLAFDRDT